jgi:riboflavin biosynthesis pyrimidine reductase
MVNPQSSFSSSPHSIGHKPESTSFDMRPKIICHMMSSIDGRLFFDRWTAPAHGINATTLRSHYDQVASRFDSDGWIVGRTTMEEIVGNNPRRVVKPAAAGLRTTHVANRKGRAVAVAIDPHGKLHYGQDDAGGDHIIAVLGEAVSDDYLSELREDGVSYLFAGPDGRDLRGALETLGEAFGLKTLLLEGGARINGSFLKEGLIDEISLLVYPGLDGLTGVPTIFEYAGGEDDQPAAGQSLRYLATETLEGGMVWLHYRVEAEASAEQHFVDESSNLSVGSETPI